MRHRPRVNLRMYRGKIEKETKRLAYQELIDWTMRNARNSHVVKVDTDEKPGCCTVTFKFIRKLSKHRILLRPRK